MKKVLKKSCWLLLITIIFGMFIIPAKPAQAIDGDEILKKVLLRGLEKCFEGNTYITGDAIGDVYGGATLDDIFTAAGRGESEDTVKVPNRVPSSNTLNQEIPAVSCKQLMNGYNGFGGKIKGLFDLTGKQFNIEQLGFHRVDIASNKQQCLKIGFSYTQDGYTHDSKDSYSNSICFAIGDDGNILYDPSNDISGFVYSNNKDASNGDIQMYLNYPGNPGYDFLISSGSFTLDVRCRWSNYNSVTFESVKTCLNSSMAEQNSFTSTVFNKDGHNIDVRFDSAIEIDPLGNSEVANSSTGSKWQKDDNNTGLQALNYFSGLSSFDEITFSEQEKYDLMEAYVKIVMDGNPDIGISDCDDDITSFGSDEYVILHKGKWCKINGLDDATKAQKFNVIKNEILQDKQALKTISFEEVLKRIKKLDFSQIDTSSSGITLPGDSDEDNVCFDNSGAIGWIICPIIEGASRVGTAMWDFIETDFLQIRAEDIFRNNSVMDEVWQKFRDIANIIFIILFLVVIFSQLTGVGIDNYGVKKIMPRLIVVAILVNLSFLICALAVDVSNILGAGLNALFTSMAGDIPQSVASAAPVEASGASMLATMGIGVGGIALFGILNPVGALTVGGVFLGIGLAVLSIVITIVFSILFMFIILIIRNAGIVILIAISPIAIVCYMLPNTEKLCKRWLDLLKALLVVYPICGALIGAGKLAANLLANIPNSPGMVIAGMIMNVLPFFLVPMLLRQSLSLMGNIGARISSFGRNAGRRTGAFAQNKITGSERVKDWSQFAQERRSGQRALRISDRLRRRATGADGRLHLDQLSERDRHRLLKADSERNSWTQKGALADVGSYLVDPEIARSRATASVNAQELKAYQDQFAGYDRARLRTEATSAGTWMGQPGSSQRMSALIQAMESNGMENDIATMLSNNNVSGDAAVMQTLAGSRNAVFSSYGKRAAGVGGAAGVSFDDYMTGAANAPNGSSMAAYINEKGKAVVDKLDDKSLHTIARYQQQIDQAGGGTQIMNGDVMTEALARKNGEDELRELRGMMYNSVTGGIRGDIAPSVTASKASNFDDQTLDQLWRVGVGRQAMSRAAEAIANNPQLVAALTDHAKQVLNDSYRVTHGRPMGSGPGIIP